MESMTGKTVVITGPTSGIGKEILCSFRSRDAEERLWSVCESFTR